MPLPPASSASDRAYTTRWDAAPNSRFFPFIREITLVVERCVSVGEVCVELDPVPDHACCNGATSLISHGRLASSAGTEIGAEGDVASTPRGFSGCGEFAALFPTRTMRFRRRARSASLSGARHGLAP